MVAIGKPGVGGHTPWGVPGLLGASRRKSGGRALTGRGAAAPDRVSRRSRGEASPRGPCNACGGAEGDAQVQSGSEPFKHRTIAMEIEGRIIFLARGEKSLTVNICNKDSQARRLRNDRPRFQARERFRVRNQRADDDCRTNRLAEEREERGPSEDAAKAARFGHRPCTAARGRPRVDRARCRGGRRLPE